MAEARERSARETLDVKDERFRCFDPFVSYNNPSLPPIPTIRAQLHTYSNKGKMVLNRMTITKLGN